MNRFKIRVALSVAVASASLTSLVAAQYAEAQSALLKACMVETQKEYGVSADIAFTECSKKSIVDCIQEMTGKKFVARSVGRKRELYIVDAGNDFTRWMEGGGWRDKGCEPHGEGPRRDGYYQNAWGKQKRSFFRQGACPSDSLEMEQVNTIQEAELLCKHGTVEQIKKDESF